jgi:hypothetical protein
MKAFAICKDEHRREDVREKLPLNGLDYLEVSEDQLTLSVYFLGKAPEHIGVSNVRIEGGRRVRDVAVREVRVHRNPNPQLDDRMEVTVDKPGDFSNYTLRLVNDPHNAEDHFLENFDARYTELDFSFKAGCPSNLDCKTSEVCPPEPRVELEINYLAKDYASFRQLILDRLALVMPDWQERHVPDIGIALVEVLAYVGDYLSYYQDAVGTEAYLGTARQRISVRRHARLVDYEMHEGCNARAWICFSTDSDIVEPPLDANDLFFLALRDDGVLPAGAVLSREDIERVPASQYEVFEPMEKDPIRVYRAHNEIHFYTWGDRECCLPRGATRATLIDGEPIEAPPPSKPAVDEEPRQSAHEKRAENYEEPAEPPKPVRELHLEPGNVLIFEEWIGPKTGRHEDADPARRHAVRLTKVEQGVDDLYGQAVLEVEWAEADALPFPLCLSVIGPPPDCAFIENVSVARGNVVLVDHGRTIRPDETLGPVEVESSEVFCECEGRPSETTLTPAKFRANLQKTPLTFFEPLKKHHTPASEVIAQDPRKALPWLKLTADPDGAAWQPRRDLLESSGDDKAFVVEIDNDAIAHLRFGDGDCGRMPDAKTVFNATYRVGNGLDGNVGAETITRVGLGDTKLSGVALTVRNPLPARGGTAPEPIAEVKLFAPRAFRKELQRAITASDYAEIVMRHFRDGVQRAGAELRWTGSWYEARVAIDPRRTEEAVPALLKKIERHLHRYRRIGHDVRVLQARYVPLAIEMTVCVLPHFLRGHVEAALRDVFTAGRRGNGQPGFFHPDNITFGSGIYVSQLVAAVQAVDGVESVSVTKLQRLFEEPKHEIARGVLPLGALEVAQLDNDLRAPEKGQLKLDLKGGR